MRRKDLRGAQEWMGAVALINSLMVWRFSALKISGSCKFVIRSVFDGGEGGVSGGSEERSNERGVLDLDESGEDVGELWLDILRSLWFCFWNSGRCV